MYRAVCTEYNSKAALVSAFCVVFLLQNNLVGISDFEWRGASKPLSSLWIGTSPELELALYTMCHLTRRNGNCDFTLAGGVNTTVTTYQWLETDMVSSAYPRCCEYRRLP